MAAVAALVLAGQSQAANLLALIARVQSAGAWGAVLFIGAYALATTAFVPAALLTLAAGALFGLYLLPRLSPMIPFAAINWSMGASRIRFRDFLIACVGMLPVTALYVYFGAVASSLTGGARTDERHGWHVAAIVASLIATFGVSRIIARAASRALASAVPVLDRTPPEGPVEDRA